MTLTCPQCLEPKVDVEDASTQTTVLERRRCRACGYGWLMKLDPVSGEMRFYATTRGLKGWRS